MKKLKFIPLILVPLVVIVGAIQYPDQYLNMFRDLNIESGPLAYQMLIVLTRLESLTETLLRVILPVIYFASRSNAVKDKVYRLFRFLFLANFILWLPITFYMIWYLIIQPEDSVSSQVTIDTTTTLIYWSTLFVSAVCLLLSRPEKKIPRINLEDYELVSYTSRWHRFLSHVVDIVFLYTTVFSLLNNFRYFATFGLSEIGTLSVLILFYLLYYFVTEYFALQTLGKIITNSVVVSTSGPLNAGKILKRSLSRFIPFDAFSFLSSVKWHDNLSHTTVVYRDTWEKVFADENLEGEIVESKKAFSV